MSAPERLTEDQATAIYDILLEECGETDVAGNERVAFALYMTDGRPRKEFRFQGALGFGGKCRINSNRPVPYVDCYPEDRTSLRDAMIDKANARIAALFAATTEVIGG